ncbi:signal peptidase I [Nocardioides sp. MH1]|uniref:signal peptidase I n=1 Tax=Nocardioides sp. MH1 TaxID=3242490 RepID=UPI00351F823D
MTRPALGRLRGAALTIGAVLGVLCALSVVAGLVLGIRPLVVQTGSMSPTIDAGALAWGRHVSADDLAVGDVVMVPKGDGDRVTHRIVAIKETNTGTFVQLKGDANPAVDAQLYPVGDDVYRVFADVPYGGRVVAWFSGPIGLFLLGMYAMGMLFVALRPRRDDGDSPSDGDDPSQGAGDGRRGKRAARRLAATSVAAFGVLVSTVAPSWATWNDTVSLLGTSLSTGSLTTPTLTCVRDNASQVTITWTAATSPAAHDYTAAVVQNSQALPVLTSGAQRSVVVTPALLAGTLGTTVTVRVTGSLPGTSWVAADATQLVTTASGGSNIDCGSTASAGGPPVTCSVVGSNGDWKIKLDWTSSSNPTTGFVVRSTGAVPGTPATLGPTLRTWTSTGFESRTGQIWVVAVNGAVETESSRISYSFGNGQGNGNKLCPSP